MSQRVGLRYQFLFWETRLDFLNFMNMASLASIHAPDK